MRDHLHEDRVGCVMWAGLMLGLLSQGSWANDKHFKGAADQSGCKSVITKDGTEECEKMIAPGGAQRRHEQLSVRPRPWANSWRDACASSATRTAARGREQCRHGGGVAEQLAPSSTGRF